MAKVLVAKIALVIVVALISLGVTAISIDKLDLVYRSNWFALLPGIVSTSLFATGFFAVIFRTKTSVSFSIILFFVSAILFAYIGFWEWLYIQCAFGDCI